LSTSEASNTGGQRKSEGAPKPDVSPTVLVVDGDGVSRRYVERALAEHALTVETAKDAAAALDILQTTPVDLILTETTLADMDGIQLLRQLSQQSHLRQMPIIFLSAEARPHMKVAAFKAGAYDYITKPCDSAELAARVSAAIERQKQQRVAFGKKSYTLAGDLSTLPFTDLVSMLELSRVSGTLYVVSRAATATLRFEKGRLVDVTRGNLRGNEAFFKVMSDAVGTFEFTPGEADETEWESGDGGFSMEETVTGLLMEAARLTDEAGAAPAGQTRKRFGTIPPPGGVPMALGDIRVLPGLAPNAALAIHFEQGVADPYTLGNLEYFTHEELKRWTSAEEPIERFHALLIADLSLGISAFLTMSSPPNERWVTQSLSREPRVLGLTFPLRQDRLVDVSLFDIKNPTGFERSFKRVPCLAIVAPLNGDLLSAGVRGAAELESLLVALAPTAILGFGGASLERALKRVPPVENGVSAFRCIPGALGTERTDLRALLIDGIRLWSSRR
jgi:DNA-binding response OmpR family regulator